MFSSKLVRIIIAVGSMAVLSSCGSQSAGGGAGEFTTVMVTASAKTMRLESDVLSGNTCPATTGTFSTDTVDVEINVTPYTNLNMAPLPVRITSATVTYTPKSSVSPPIPAQPFSVGETVTSGTLKIPVPVAPEILKAKLISDYNLQPCTASLYEYYVTITFDAVEVGGSGESHQFSTNTTVAFADRAESTSESP